MQLTQYKGEPGLFLVVLCHAALCEEEKQWTYVPRGKTLISLIGYIDFLFLEIARNNVNKEISQNHRR